MKIISIFNNEINLDKLTEKLGTQGINNIHIRDLSTNHRQEILEEVFVSDSEKYGAAIGFLIGATLGNIISYLLINDVIIFPLFLRLEAAGTIAFTFFWVVLGIIMGTFIGALSGLAYEKIQTEEGNKMLIVYCNIQQRKIAKSLIRAYEGQII